MTFYKIDLQTWNKSDSYLHYLDAVPCTYSMTVNLDITTFLEQMKEKKYKFFPAFLYGISHTVNKHKEFRMDLDVENNVGYYEISNPSFTVFHNETETFTNLWTAYSADFKQFMQNYTNDMEKYQWDSQNEKPITGKNLFNVSCIPWTSFTGFNLNLKNGYDYFPPIFTIGKFYADGERTIIPLAIQVHHAVCDGFHVSRFVNDMQEFLDTFTL